MWAPGFQSEPDVESGFTIQFLMELVGEYDGAVGERSNMCIFLGVSLSGEYLSSLFLKRVSCTFCNTAYLFGLVVSQWMS